MRKGEWENFCGVPECGHIEESLSDLIQLFKGLVIKSMVWVSGLIGILELLNY